MDDCCVSVIIPVYNVSKYVERCARALFSQTLKDGVEFIFVDDASPDDSIDKVKASLCSFPERQSQCVFLAHSENRGLTATRNTGLAAARGEYIVHSDSDDWMEESMLETMFTRAKASSADIVYCDFFFQYADHVERYQCAPWGEDKVTSLNRFIESPWTVIWNIMAKRELYVKNGLHSYEGIGYYEDFNLVAKLMLEAKRVEYLPIPLHNYNQLNQSSIMHTFSSKHMYDEVTACSDVVDYYIKRGEFSKYAEQLSYRMLKAKKEFILHKESLCLFVETSPETNDYILTCPHLNTKLKIMAWFLCHNMKWVTAFIIICRNRYRSLIQG